MSKRSREEKKKAKKERKKLKKERKKEKKQKKKSKSKKESSESIDSSDEDVSSQEDNIKVPADNTVTIDDSSEDEEIVMRKVVARKSQNTNSDSSDESIDLSPLKNKDMKSRASLQDSSDEEDDVSTATPNNNSTRTDTTIENSSPIRHSPRKSINATKQKISSQTKSDDDDDDLSYSDQDEDEMIQEFKLKRKQKDDDDSYVEDDSEDDENVDDDSEGNLMNGDMFVGDVESSDDEEEDEETLMRRNINNDDIFDKEDDDFPKSPEKSVALTPLKVKTRGQFEYEEPEQDTEILNSQEIDDEAFDVITSPRMLFCTSEFDEITQAALPKIHVCYLAPDKRTRHCFCLDTIYLASIMSGTKKTDSQGRLKFLQPPHFRTVMEDTLVDQIASRFGRKALIIEESDVYKKKQGPGAKTFDANQTLIELEGDDDGITFSFEEYFSNYLQDQMGSGDIYCCPLCYCEAQHRCRDGSEEDDESSDVEDDDFEYNMENITSYSRLDPMSILGSLDHDEFKVAATFCSTRLATVKKHIQNVHNIDTSEVEINDFLKRFMIRAQDGLLQSFLKAFWNSRVFDGAMRKYWNEGHNQSFILLRLLTERYKFDTSLNPESIDNSFCTSFPVRARKMWQQLSGPYWKGDESDFIADDDEEIADEVHPMFEKPEDMEENFAQHLRNKIASTKGKKHGYDSSSSSSSESELADEDEEEDVVIDVNDSDGEGDVYIEESSEDEWVHKRRTKTKRKKFMNRLKRVRQDSDDDDDQDADDLFQPAKKKKYKSKALSLDDSSEESNASDSEEDDIPKKRPTPRKQLLVDSDDE